MISIDYWLFTVSLKLSNVLLQWGIVGLCN